MADRSDARLSAHFSLREFDPHDGGYVPAEHVQALRDLCAFVLEPMRARFGRCTVISGYRSVSHNRAVGGAPKSHHLYKLHPDSPAADVSFARGTPEQWAALAISMRVGGVGLYPGHVHVDRRRITARW